MGPLWMADLMYLFRRHSPTELQKLIEGETVLQFDWEITPAFSCIYNKYDRGDVFPGPDRIKRWLDLCAAAERVPKLLLWDVLDPKPFTTEAAGYVWERLVPEVKRLVNLSGKWSFPKLRQLTRLCHVDALTAMLMLIRLDLDRRRQNDPPGKAYFIIPHVREAFFSLSIFPPFQNLRRLFYGYLGALAFTVEFNGKLIRDPGPAYLGTEVTNELIFLMKHLGRIGLLGQSLNAQIKFVNWYRRNINDEMKRSIYHHCFVSAPTTLEPSDPLWKALKRLRHPGTRNGGSIQLPWKGRVIPDFRIANVLGDAVVHSPGHAKPSRRRDNRRLADSRFRSR